MDTLDVTDPHYSRKISDLQRRYDEQYDKMGEIEGMIDEMRTRIRQLRQEQISSDNIYQLLLVFDKLYCTMTEAEQKDFLEAMDYAQSTPSLSQAQRLKQLSKDGHCSLDAMCAVLSEEKKSELNKVTFKNDVLRKYFPKSYTPKQMEDTIIRLLEQWQRKRQRDMER